MLVPPRVAKMGIESCSICWAEKTSIAYPLHITGDSSASALKLLHIQNNFVLKYPVLHPFVDEDESKKFRSSGNCRKPALAVGSLAGRLECVASPKSKHTKNLPQTDEKRGIGRCICTNWPKM